MKRVLIHLLYAFCLINGMYMLYLTGYGIYLGYTTELAKYINAPIYFGLFTVTDGAGLIFGSFLALIPHLTVAAGIADTTCVNQDYVALWNWRKSRKVRLKHEHEKAERDFQNRRRTAEAYAATVRGEYGRS